MHDDLGARDSMRHLLFDQRALGNFRVRNGDESVQLCLKLKFFAHPLRQADAAGAHIQSDGGTVPFFVMSHDFSPRQRSPL